MRSAFSVNSINKYLLNEFSKIYSYVYNICAWIEVRWIDASFLLCLIREKKKKMEKIIYPI